MSDFKDVTKQLLGSLAPMIGTAVGGPFGGIAGQMLSKALGVPESKVDATMKNMTPQQVVKVKNADLEFKKFMEESGIKREELNFKDRDSARKMASELGANPQKILATLYTSAYFLILFGLFSGALVLPADSPILTGLVLVLTTGQAQVLNFFFGSSSGSKEKTALMKR